MWLVKFCIWKYSWNMKKSYKQDVVASTCDPATLKVLSKPSEGP